MKFITMRELRNTPGRLWEALASRDTVALVGDGAPRALLLEIPDGDLEGTLEVLRRTRAQLALSRLRQRAGATPPLSNEEIDAEVQAERAERQHRAAER